MSYTFPREINKLLMLMPCWTFSSEYMYVCLTAKAEAATQYAVVVGLEDGTTTINKSVVKINLHQPSDITAQEQIPTTMAEEAVAAVYDNTMYVA